MLSGTFHCICTLIYDKYRPIFNFITSMPIQNMEMCVL